MYSTISLIARHSAVILRVGLFIIFHERNVNLLRYSGAGISRPYTWLAIVFNASCCASDEFGNNHLHIILDNKFGLSTLL